MIKPLRDPRFRTWLAIAGTATIVLVAAYTMVQQSTRLAADDLPLATAQTVKHELENGTTPADVIPAIKTDLKTDSTVFVTVTDAQQHVLASSATLNGQPSLPPQGTFDYTSRHDTDHFTWQPQAGVRLATRILTYKIGSTTGFIVTGRSLSQTESRTDEYGKMALAAWVAVLAWSYVLILLPRSKKTV